MIFSAFFLSRPFPRCIDEKLPTIPVIGLFSSVKERVRKTDPSDSDETSMFFTAVTVALEKVRSSHDKRVNLHR